MPEKLTLAVYLERRGAVKALTRIEAEVFGVQYPLVKGWAHRHGADEITQVMLDELQEKIGRARSSTAEKAQRGLAGLVGLEVSSCSAPASKTNVRALSSGRCACQVLFPGFVVRAAKSIRRRSIANRRT